MAPTGRIGRVEQFNRQIGLNMVTQEFKLRGEYVALCDLLKLAGIADSGGQGKLMIENGNVTVDGQPENRKKAKIRANQTVQCLGQTVLVLSA